MERHHNPATTRACERALFLAARSCAATRQQIRAAARAFVRRHRRDAAYLAWVRRSAGANSALAIAVLGLSAAPASAELAPFAPLTGAANPFNGLAIGSASFPALADLDGDGDLDLASSNQPGGLSYYENTGNPVSAGPFVLRTGAASPFWGWSGPAFRSPTFGDLDGDGDLDLITGQGNGVFRYFENTGSAKSPAFVEVTGTANPLDGVTLGQPVHPALGDLDRDGDLDLVAGDGSGKFFYFENTGSKTNPLLVARTGPANPLNTRDVGFESAPALADLDRDGDLDLVSGEEYGTFLVFENTGTARVPVFAPRTGAVNPLDGRDVGYSSTPALGDLDGDGDPDLVSGDLNGTFAAFANQRGQFANGVPDPFTGLSTYAYAPALGDLDADGDLDLVATNVPYGTFRYFQNTGSPAIAVFLERTGSANPLNGQDTQGTASISTLADLDGDGDLDLVAGNYLGTFDYFRNTGSPTSAAFVAQTGGTNPLAGLDVGAWSVPSFADLDGDGDLDLVSGRSDGTFFYCENTGSATFPGFVPQYGIADPLDGQHAGGAFGIFSRPTLGDFDGDGDLDLVTSYATQYPATSFSWDYFENTGSATSGAFVRRTGSANPVQGPSLAPMSTAGDLDADGDLDLVAGGHYLRFLENLLAPAPHATERTGAQNPLNGQDVGSLATPALGDLDGDGDLDVVAGNAQGAFAYFENTGSAIAPVFVSRTGSQNPLDGEYPGGDATPALGDLDRDGDLDLVVGEANYGTFRYYANTGTATDPQFVAQTGASNPLDGIVLYRPTAALGDLDGDGDLDFVADGGPGFFLYCENTASGPAAAFVQRGGPANPFYGLLSGSYSVRAIADLDRDGDLDLMAGQSDGHFRYFQNTGDAVNPGFVERTAAGNPLDGKDVGSNSAPASGDLNGDGHPDLVSGVGDGTFNVYYFPEPGRGALLGAGAALLRWLRGRGRPRDQRSS